MLFVLCPLSGAGDSPILPLPGWWQWFLSLPGPKDGLSAGSVAAVLTDRPAGDATSLRFEVFPPLPAERLSF